MFATLEAPLKATFETGSSHVGFKRWQQALLTHTRVERVEPAPP
jgi:hypothetical protein